MPARTRWLLACGVLSLLCLAGWIVTQRVGEPTYAGKDLSQWLLLNKKAGPAALPLETQTAIQALGSGSIPYLERWAEYRSSRSHDWVWTLIQKLKSGKVGEAEQWTRARRAVYALNCLGTEEAFGSLLNVTMVQTNPPVRDSAIELICDELKARPPHWLSVVVRGATNADGRVALAGVRALAEFPRDRKVAVETLIIAIHHSDPVVRGTAAQTLAFYGRDALPATPALLNALSDTELDVRLMASYALRQIAPTNIERGGQQEVGRR